MKKVKRRIMSFFVAVTMIFSSVTFGAMSTPAAAAGSGMTNTLINAGLKIFGKVLTKALTAGSDENTQELTKAAGIINTVLFGSAGSTANKLNEISALCKEILAEVKKMESQMNESFALVEQMLGEQNAAAARKAQDDKWKADVADVIDKYNASQAIEQYLVYMDAAAKYADDTSNASLRADFENQKDTLMLKLALMYSDQIPLDIVGDREKLEEYIFTNNLIDNAFINMINELSAKLVKTNSSTVTLAETAAQTADSYLPFSHQQYEFIYTVIEEQLMELTNCILLAAEYYDLQGEYILKTDGEGSAVHNGYMKLLGQLNTLIYGGSQSSVTSRIDTMLNAQMVISTNVKKSLDDYMRPEDAVSVNMQIQNYKESYDYLGSTYDVYYTVNKKYIDEYVRFNRVMVGDTVYYIIDPEQFTDTPLALSTSALEKKDAHQGMGDEHFASMDFINLVKSYSDNSNIFTVPYNTHAYDQFISTNSFFVAGGVPKTYLQGYVPVPTDKDKTLYLLTSRYVGWNSGFLWNTTYADYWMVEASKSFGSGTLTATKVSGKVLQPDHSGDNKRFSVILTQQSDVYQQPLALDVSGSGVVSANLTITPDTGKTTVIKNGESKKVTSGEKLSINVKLTGESEITSIKCIRDTDPFGSGGESEYEIIGADDFEALTPNADGSYTVDYVVPYTSARIVVETQPCIFDNGICTVCGDYQPAALNAKGVYEIGNAGQFFWYAEMINGTTEHSVYDKQNSRANGILTADIDLEYLGWTPIRNFGGVFDGKGYTISGLSIPKATSDNTGLFGSVSGEIKNFTVEGEIVLYSLRNNIGGAVGSLNSGGKVSRVISKVNIASYGNSADNAKEVGGVVGYCAGEIFDCAYIGNINLSRSSDVGGIAGYIEGSRAVVKNCYCYGNIVTDADPLYADSYGAIAGNVISFKEISNNYYLDTAAKKAFYTGSYGNATATSKTAAQFKSGEVAYLLNNKVTDGTQSWYQNINSGNPDIYPQIKGGAVYLCFDFYTNKADGIFGVNDEGKLMIQSYEELVNLAELVRTDNKTYGSKKYILTNNIIAPDNSVWEHSIGTYEGVNAPFIGEFDGNGYCIIGLNGASQEYCGVFGAIGSGGYVHDLFVADCSFSGTLAGGIAALNYGTIDHCVVGVNYSENSVNYNGNTIDISSANTSVSGEKCGGIVGTNVGVIKGCRNAADVSAAKFGGGIAGENNDEIYGCVNNGSVSGSSDAYLGGLVGYNQYNIKSSYNSAVIGSGNACQGSVMGYSGGVKVTDVFYVTTESLPAKGEGYAAIDSSCVAITDVSEFKTDAFTDKLNAVTDDSIVWVRSDNINSGYPRIQGRFLEQLTKSVGHGIDFSGLMHGDINIRLEPCGEGDDGYKTLTSKLGSNMIHSAYTVIATDRKGNAVPVEEWVGEDIRISIPVDGENVCLAALENDGGMAYYEPDSVDDGTAVFTMTNLTHVLAVCKKGADNYETGVDVTAVVPVAVVSLAAIIVFGKRKRSIR